MSAAAGRVLPAIGAEAGRKQRNPVLPVRLSARLSLVSRVCARWARGCCVPCACGGAGCPARGRRPPAMDGRAEWGTDGRLADVRNFRRWAVPPENPPDSRGLIVVALRELPDRKSTRLNSSHLGISYAVFC